MYIFCRRRRLAGWLSSRATGFASYFAQGEEDGRTPIQRNRHDDIGVRDVQQGRGRLVDKAGARAQTDHQAGDGQNRASGADGVQGGMEWRRSRSRTRTWGGSRQRGARDTARLPTKQEKQVEAHS